MAPTTTTTTPITTLSCCFESNVTDIIRYSVSPEAVAFLGFVAVCLVLLIVFFMYLNKMFCFRTIGGFPCVDRPPKKRFDATTGREYGVAEEDEDDDLDSEDDAVSQFQRHKSVRMSTKEQAKTDAEGPDGEAEEGEEVSPVSKEDEATGDQNAIYNIVAAAVDHMTEKSAAAEGGEEGEANQRAVDANLTETQPILVPIALDLPDSKELAIEMAICYFTSRGDLTVNVKQVKNTPNADWQYQVHIAILPAKKFTFRTNYERGENPAFLALFTCQVPAESLPDTYVRLRLYSRSLVLAPSKLVGAAIVSLSTLPKDLDVSRWAQLQPSEEGLWAIDLIESTPDQQQQKQANVLEPGLSVGLAYSALTGRLAVEIGQAHGINKLLRQAPQKLETYVKILVMLGPTADRLLAQTKTRLSKGLSPTFKEKFVFQVAQFQLADVSLGIMLYTRRRENIGWVAIGSIADQGTLESTHWAELRSAAAAHSPEMLTRIHKVRLPEGAQSTKAASMAAAEP